jgi:RNA polymerase sigma factor for flagellar operon FliA
MFDELDELEPILNEDSSDIPQTIFTQDSNRFHKLPRLTENELVLLQINNQTRILWSASLRLVIYVYSQLKRIGYLTYLPAGMEMDVIQAGNLAALGAIPRWNPDKGKFSTFLVPRIRGAMLDYAADQARWASLTKSQPITQENASDEYYDDWEGAPFDPEAAWDSPEATIQDGAQNDTATDDVSYEATLGAELREAIALLEAQLHNDIVLRYYQDNSIDHIAKLNGVSRQTVHSRIKQAIEILRSILVTDCPK